MQGIKQNFKQLAQITSLALLLFAVLPCKVKAVFLPIDALETQHVLHKTKTSFPLNCSSDSLQRNESKVVEIASNQQVVTHSFWVNSSKSDARSTEIIPLFSAEISGKSPPKYILFKRLKIAIA